MIQSKKPPKKRKRNGKGGIGDFAKRFREVLCIPHEMWDDDALFDMVRMCYDWEEPNKVPIIDMLADLDDGKFEWNPEQWRIKFKDTVILSTTDEIIRYCRNSMHDAIGMLNICAMERTSDTSTTRRNAMFILHDIKEKLDMLRISEPKLHSKGNK